MPDHCSASLSGDNPSSELEMDIQSPWVKRRSAELLAVQSNQLCMRADRRFALLLIVQYFFGIVIACYVSPLTWAGTESQIHPHVLAAVVMGGAIISLPLTLALVHPGKTQTRHAIAIGEALWSGLLIHLLDGRIEAHFHIFGALAFLSIYRDWRVLVTATVVTALDHFIRGVYWPQSVFGALTVSPWLWLEHVAWVLYTASILVPQCNSRRREMGLVVQRQATLEETREHIEKEIHERTAELRTAKESVAESYEALLKVNDEKDQLNSQLSQAQKLESIGQLAAGIAHEINTPTQYVGDNTRFLQESFKDLTPTLKLASELANGSQTGPDKEGLATELKAALLDADVEYLDEEIPRAIEQSLEGIERVRKIVNSMKEFSHPGLDEMKPMDINHIIENTVTVTSNEWKYIAEMDLDLAPDLPIASCLPGELSQVFLNLIVNAVHAIADVVGEGENGKGTIYISTRHDQDTIEVRITDSGTGVPEAARESLFNPFFTTKEVGKGTGQGLSIAYGVVVKKHGGTIDFETEMGKGTTFIIRLPREYQGVEELKV
ncbi:MAG: signal transduction histidine kinase [Planctomycetota bacterium]|jgi:signal transduction histidine kinase